MPLRVASLYFERGGNQVYRKKFKYTDNDFAAFPRYLDMLAGSCERHGLPFEVITDERSSVDHPACRVPVDTTYFSVATMDAIRLYLERQLGPVLVVDPDCLIVKDPREVFDGSFDMGLTYREKSHWPSPHFQKRRFVNGGVIYALNPKMAARYFADVVARHREYAESEQKLIPFNEDAMCDVIRRHVPIPNEWERTTWEVSGVKTRFFPMQTHNFVPKGAPINPPDCYVAHFTSDAKRNMEACYRAWL